MLDVYRDSNKVEHHPGYFALYISFFPQLVAGPIERAHNILPQLREKTSFNLERTSQGLALALWGYFKKLAIADRLGLYVDQIYAAPTDYSALQTCMATLFFSFQIYCDFSAYTDIARGVSHVFGIRLMENFQTPYFATSIQDFWRRWHISLSSWFRDYVYIPLGGSKQTTARTMFNVLFVFAICGLWHGAAWNFMLWGLSHGLLLVLSMLIALPSTRKATPQSPPPGLLINISKTIVIFTLVTLAWVLFRTRDLTHAAVVYERMYCIFSEQLPIQETGLIQGAKKLLLSLAPDGNTHSVILSCFFLIILLALDLARSKKDYLEWYGGLATFSRWCLCYFLFFSTVIFGRLGISQFIYFQF
jgi:D-alanyl-lipoteichoic acid acyltransferase DltB (MBOAT superfamily)